MREMKPPRMLKWKKWWTNEQRLSRGVKLEEKRHKWWTDGLELKIHEKLQGFWCYMANIRAKRNQLRNMHNPKASYEGLYTSPEDDVNRKSILFTVWSSGQWRECVRISVTWTPCTSARMIFHAPYLQTRVASAWCVYISLVRGLPTLFGILGWV